MQLLTDVFLGKLKINHMMELQFVGLFFLSFFLYIFHEWYIILVLFYITLH
jgi:hypothetical protein